MTEESKLSFEEAVTQLNEIVEQLEQGDVPLEQAISIYKKGMELSKFCHEKLKNVEKQLTEILTEDGQTERFSIDEGD